MPTGALLLLLFGGDEYTEHVRTFSDTASAMHAGLPLALQGAPEYQAINIGLAKEIDLLDAARSTLMEQWFPQKATIGLPWWEALVRATPAPGATTEQRQQAALSRAEPGIDSGSDWYTAVTNEIGAGWMVQEHDPGDTTGPDEFSIWVFVPFSPSSLAFASAKEFIEATVPANLIPSVQSLSGFTLDQSHLDEQSFGF